MFWLLEPRWFAVCGVVGLLTYGGGFWQGWKHADRSAEIATLKSDVTAAHATIATLRKRAASDAAAVNAYSQREQLANEALTDMQEQIDAISQSVETLPAADVCRLNRAQYEQLRDLATRAAGHRAPVATRP
jgi:hypothetical protein